MSEAGVLQSNAIIIGLDSGRAPTNEQGLTLVDVSMT